MGKFLKNEIIVSKIISWLSVTFLIFALSVTWVFWSFWRTVGNTFDTMTEWEENFEYGYGYGALGWGYGYGYWYGYGSYEDWYYFEDTTWSVEDYSDPVTVDASTIENVATIEGSLTDASSVTITKTAEFTSEVNWKVVNVILPTLLVIKSANWNFNAWDLAVNLISSTDDSVSTLNDVKWAISFGVSWEKLIFNKPIKVLIPWDYTTTSVYVSIKHEWDTSFNISWLTNDPNSTCNSDGTSNSPYSIATVIDWKAVIYTCSASTFATYMWTNTSTVSSWGGGWGGWSYTPICRDNQLYCNIARWKYYKIDWENCTWWNLFKSCDDPEYNINNTVLLKDTNVLKKEINVKTWKIWTIKFANTLVKNGYKLAKITWSEWKITLKANNSSTIYVNFLSDTSVAASDTWNWEIEAPILITNDKIRAAWITIVKVWSSNEKLMFNKDVYLVVPVNLDNWTLVKVSTSSDSKNWVEHDEYIVSNGKVTIKTNHFSYFAIEKVKSNVTFSDIDNTFAKAYIEKLASMWVVNGENGNFYPENNATRAEYVKMILNAMNYDTDVNVNSLTFADVDKNGWQAKYIAKAVELGLVSDSNVNFRPNDNISRVEAIKILLKASNIDVTDTNTNSFSDVTTDWMIKYTEKAKSLGIVNGQEVNWKLIFRPNDSITRAEVAKIIVKSID